MDTSNSQNQVKPQEDFEDRLRPIEDFSRLLSESVGLLAGRCKYQTNRPRTDDEKGDEVEELESKRSNLLRTSLLISRSIINSSLKNESESVTLIQSLASQFNDNSNDENQSSGNNPSKINPSSSLAKNKLITTKLQELYVGEEDRGDEAKFIDDRSIWKQISMKHQSVMNWVKHTLDHDFEDEKEEEQDDDDENDERTQLINKKKLALGLPTDDYDDEQGEGEPDLAFSDSEDDDDDTEELTSFSSSSSSSSLSNDRIEQEESKSYIVNLNDQKPTKRTAASDADSKLKSKNFSLEDLESRNQSDSKSPKQRQKSIVDDQFFSLAEFEEETDLGERQMRRVLTGQGEDRGSDDDDDDEDGEEIDLFKSYDDEGSEDDDEDEDEAEDSKPMDIGSAAANIRYNDFFGTPRESGVNSSKKRKQTKEGAKTKGEKDKINSKGKGKSGPRVMFSEEVIVKEIPAKNKGSRVADMLGDGLDLGEDDDSDPDYDVDDDDEDGDEDGDGESEDGSSEETGSSQEDDENSNESHSSHSNTDSNDTDNDTGSGNEGGGGSDEKTMTRITQDLFEDGFGSGDDDYGSGDDDYENLDPQRRGENQKISRHAKRLKALSKQISELEAENVGKKDWTLKGEASAKERPQNSLLEEDLEFEHIQKIAPPVTEERTLGLEAIIKKRIIDGQFDDVIRKRPIDPKAFLPSRLLELQDTKSSRSLAEIYEDEYKNSKIEEETGSKPMNQKDEKLEKEHSEIKEILEDLFGKLDALSNAHFTPKQPKTTIKTINNLPSISLESALPVGISNQNVLAPEEIYSVKNDFKQNVFKDFEELNHSQKQLVRQNLKRKRKSNEKKIENVIGGGGNNKKVKKDGAENKNDIGGNDGKKKSKRMSVKEEKEKSLKELEKVKGVQILKTK